MIVIPKNNQPLEFYHEHPLLRQAVSQVDLAGIQMLMGNLQFQNEVGYTTFEIRTIGKPLVEVTLEIFPSKLDYQKGLSKATL